MANRNPQNSEPMSAHPNSQDLPPDMIAVEQQPTGFGGRIRNYFLTGLVVAGPLAVTAWLIWSFVTWVDDLVRPLTFLGFLTANLVGRTLLQIGENLLDRMPVVRPIYKTVKQIFTMLFSKSGTSFRKVGLVEFPAPGMWSLVFLSQPPSADIASRLPEGDDQISVFMPCTPNPTTGFFFYLPRRMIVEIDIPVEAAATLLMSAGMIQPGGNADQQKLSALAATARSAQLARSKPETAPAK
jgi:uncharacterized membrane protein